MAQETYLFCLVLMSCSKIFEAAFIPLRPLIPSTSTYKPSTLLLPPGFESQKAPPEPMLYPYAVSSSGDVTVRPTFRIFSSSTPDWIPVALNVKKDFSLKRNLHSTTATPSVPVLKDRTSNDGLKYSSPVYKEGPVFESIVYGTWKPDPPLQPLKVSTSTKQQQQHPVHANNINMSSNTISDGKVYNKTINRQHGGFLGNIQHKSIKTNTQISLTPLPPSVEHKSKELFEMVSEPKLSTKVKKQGRRRIPPIVYKTENNMIHKSEVATTTQTSTTKEYSRQQQNVVKVNATDPKLMEVVKQINESLEIKYNHKQTSTHSIDMMTMTTAEADNDEDDNNYDYVDSGTESDSTIQWPTHSNEFLSTEPQLDYDDYPEGEILNISATRRSWPADFLEEPFATTDGNYPLENTTNEIKFNESLEADPSEIPLALSALNIPPSLWPKLPGNITKLGKPYEAESSAEEPALCVPITVREQNIMNTNELVYIERVFCFPMPLSTTTTTENSLSIFDQMSSSSSTTTLRTVATTKVQNFEDFISSSSRVSTANNFKHQFYLVSSILVIYFKLFI